MKEINCFYFKTDLTPKQTLFSKGAAKIWVPGRVKPGTCDANFGIQEAWVSLNLYKYAIFPIV